VKGQAEDLGKGRRNRIIITGGAVSPPGRIKEPFREQKSVIREVKKKDTNSPAGIREERSSGCGGESHHLASLLGK